jgi:hypothetical protein
VKRAGEEASSAGKPDGKAAKKRAAIKGSAGLNVKREAAE